MRSVIIPFLCGLAVAMVIADPLQSLRRSLGVTSGKSAVGTCPSKDPANPVYLPDSESCSAFYECSHGTPVPKECMEGLCFDPILNVCAFPNDVRPLSAVGTCPPRDGNSTTYLPDDKNCTVYYVCSNGVPIERECSVDMSWNPKLNICDWEIDVGCESGKIQPLSAVGTCPPRDGNQTIYLADDKNCSLYYVCSNGVANENVCLPDMVWDSRFNVCNWEIDVGCELKKRLALAPYSPVGECPPHDPANPIFLPDSESCKIYYECSTGKPIANSCPGALEFNPVLMVCDFPLDAGCTSSNSTDIDM